MKRLTFLAIIAALFSINAAKAQVRVHVGLNFGTPVYQPRRVVVVHPAPVYYPQTTYYQEPVYQEPVYQQTYYASPEYTYYHRRHYVHRAAYYEPRRVVVVNRSHRHIYRR